MLSGQIYRSRFFTGASIQRVGMIIPELVELVELVKPRFPIL